MKLISRLFALLTVVAATATHASEPVQMPDAPPLASLGKYITNEEITFLPTDPQSAWTFWRSIPITDYLEPTERIPAISEIKVLKGPWGEPGSIRRLTFENGGHAHERVLTSDEGEFTYQIWDLNTDSGIFINHIYGEFRVRPANDGSEIVWRYNIKPAVFVARPFIRQFLEEDFGPFMQGGMAGVAAQFPD